MDKDLGAAIIKDKESPTLGYFEPLDRPSNKWNN
jgi:hypothetical protein